MYGVVQIVTPLSTVLASAKDILLAGSTRLVGNNPVRDAGLISKPLRDLLASCYRHVTSDALLVLPPIKSIHGMRISTARDPTDGGLPFQVGQKPPSPR